MSKFELIKPESFIGPKQTCPIRITNEAKLALKELKQLKSLEGFSDGEILEMCFRWAFRESLMCSKEEHHRISECINKEIIKAVKMQEW